MGLICFFFIYILKFLALLRHSLTRLDVKLVHLELCQHISFKSSNWNKLSSNALLCCMLKFSLRRCEVKDVSLSNLICNWVTTQDNLEIGMPHKSSGRVVNTARSIIYEKFHMVPRLSVKLPNLVLFSLYKTILMEICNFRQKPYGNVYLYSKSLWNEYKTFCN